MRSQVEVIKKPRMIPSIKMHMTKLETEPILSNSRVIRSSEANKITSPISVASRMIKKFYAVKFLN